MKWDDYYMKIAHVVSMKSKDTTRVGCIVVDPEGAVILTGFNGPPRGVLDLPDRFARPEKYKYAAHSESNVISFAARRGIMTKGCSVYVTHMPCSACTRTLIQAGIREIIYDAGQFQGIEEDRGASEAMASEAGVVFARYRCEGV